MKIDQFFNPSEHLVFHQDKDGNMIGGGYKVNNMLYQNKMPLFVSPMTGGGGGGGHDDEENPHFIPEKFSDLFRDLAVPAGLFMMPALFRPRNYAACVTEPKPRAETEAEAESEDSDDETGPRKPVPNDIFDTLLSLVTPSERIQHDVKTRRNKGEKEKKRLNKTRRGKRAEF
jgi:hypothetical protein